jgi:TetR/AcrR family transcriptional regulator
MTQQDKLTEEKIFTAASQEFEEKGMEGARMQDIADRAGINKALLHYYFRTKDKLFAAVFEKLAKKMFNKFVAIFEMDMPLEDKIQYFFTEHISFLEKNPKLPLFILREVNRKPQLVDTFLEQIKLSNIKNGINKSLTENSVKEDQIAHILVSIVSLSVFPIVAKPIISGILKQQDTNYEEFLEQRKEYSPGFIMSIIQNMGERTFSKSE